MVNLKQDQVDDSKYLEDIHVDAYDGSVFVPMVNCYIT